MSLLLVLLLSACGGEPQPLDISQSTTPSGLNRAIATVSAQDVDLPGRLLFVRAGDLWVWQGAAGSQLTAQGDLAQPAWSPDGTEIACVQRGASFSDIVLLPANGGNAQRLTDGGSTAALNSFERAQSTIWSFYPTFAPDGQSIAYASQAGPAIGEPATDYNLTLYSMVAVVGGERTQLYASEEGMVGDVAHAPDGSMVFAFQPTGEEQPSVRRYSEGASLDINGMPEQSYDPAFSPDGMWLAFAARQQGATDIHAMPSGGGTPIRLTQVGSARAPAISPDGKWLAFLALTPGTSSFDLWIAPLTQTADVLEAGEPRAITNGMRLDADSGLAWGA